MVTADAVASKLSSRLRTADAAVPQPFNVYGAVIT